ncbi:C45 family peptidase [Nisaea sp.]|uniref:C45 family peptidase n=1 Tax=Nisaea sp. TaxID=2024842 RepID=UPI002B274869|nr:C45 family peptidase [Nisaea sp.]
MEKLFRAVDEPQPGVFARQSIEEGRVFVADWYAKAERIPGPEECRRRVGEHMPEILGLFDSMAVFAGDDPAMIAALAGIDPPPLIPAGCTVRAFTRPRPTMLRNYDFHPDATSAVILRTDWSGRGVLGMSEGISGLLDGVNDAGVAAALTFGGRHVYGSGFSIVQIIRYLLQVASDVKEAADVLRRMPCAWSHNVLAQDRSGKAIRAELAPDRAPLVTEGYAVTNHQADVEPRPDSAQRFDTVCALTEDAETARAVFVERDLRKEDFDEWLGTLYTAEYMPGENAVKFHWRDGSWAQSLMQFEPGERRVTYPG